MRDRSCLDPRTDLEPTRVHAPNTTKQSCSAIALRGLDPWPLQGRAPPSEDCARKVQPCGWEIRRPLSTVELDALDVKVWHL
jgi:hypothetical protein